jgi:hypothetical protein
MCPKDESGGTVDLCRKTSYSGLAIDKREKGSSVHYIDHKRDVSFAGKDGWVLLCDEIEEGRERLGVTYTRYNAVYAHRSGNAYYNVLVYIDEAVRRDDEGVVTRRSYEICSQDGYPRTIYADSIEDAVEEFDRIEKIKVEG